MIFDFVPRGFTNDLTIVPGKVLKLFGTSILSTAMAVIIAFWLS